MVGFRAKQLTYLDKENRRTFSRWHPQVKIGKAWAFLEDTRTKTKLVEADDEAKAVDIAYREWRKINGQV